MRALLSSLLETWQSVQFLVVPRALKVCGTLVLKAIPLKPSLLIVCCWT